jgi:hypothetical protein
MPKHISALIASLIEPEEDFYLSDYGAILYDAWGTLGPLSDDETCRRFQAVEIIVAFLSEDQWSVRRVHQAINKIQPYGKEQARVKGFDLTQSFAFVILAVIPGARIPLPRSVGFGTGHLRTVLSRYWNGHRHKYYIASMVRASLLKPLTDQQLIIGRIGETWEDGPQGAMGGQMPPATHPFITSDHLSRVNLPPFGRRLRSVDIGHLCDWRNKKYSRIASQVAVRNVLVGRLRPERRSLRQQKSSWR